MIFTGTHKNIKEAIYRSFGVEDISVRTVAPGEVEITVDNIGFSKFMKLLYSKDEIRRLKNRYMPCGISCKLTVRYYLTTSTVIEVNRRL